MISEVSCNSFPKGPFLRIEHTDCCSKDTVKGSLNVEWAVFPLCKRVAAIPDEATANAVFPDCRTLANIKLERKVFPVPPGASKKNMFPLLFSTLSIIESYAIFWSATNFDIFDSTNSDKSLKLCDCNCVGCTAVWERFGEGKPKSFRYLSLSSKSLFYI